MLRVASILSILTWTSLLVGATIAMWPIALASYQLQYAVLLALALIIMVPCSVTLIRNRPFGVGLSFLVSIVGAILFGLFGFGVLFYCVLCLLASGSFIGASAVEWFYGVNNTIMLALPICWAFLWRDYRNEIADQHLTKRWS